jgi:two-component system response regulator MprA
MADQAAGGAAPAPILVVEDDPRIRETIQWVLEEEGYEVETAADGQQALDRVAARRPRLLVLDMMLPGLDGAGVADGLLAAYGEKPPILLITADGRAQAKAQRVGAFAYLNKPFELDDLVALVRQGVGESA